MTPSRPVRPLLCLLVVLAWGSGCITRSVNDKVFDDGYTQAFLHSEKRGTKLVAQGYQHPVVIAPVRMAHILSRIDLRWMDEKNERMAAVPLETLFLIADALAKALEQASPDQSVIVQSIRRGKSLVIFERQYLTSLLAYQKDDLLYIYLPRADWELPPRKDDRLPWPQPGEFPLSYRLVVDKGMTLADQQTVAVEWQDPIFRKPTRTRVTPTGKVVRRTVLMESMEDDTEFDPPPQMPQDLTSEQLRALADLEDARQRGELTETEYTARRNEILRGETPQP